MALPQVSARPHRPSALVSLSSYGREEAQRRGQAALAAIAAEAGADGVEYRGELQRGGGAEHAAELAAELADQRAVAEQHRLQVVWSSPEGLWSADGGLDAAAIERAYADAAAVGASRVKMSLGAYTIGHDVGALLRRIEGHAIELVVENDQTPRAGTLPALLDFFAAMRSAGMPLGMTFDMGNWHWTGEAPLQAAVHCAQFVTYVHCKGVQRQPQQWVAVPLAASAAPWRAILRALPADVPRAVEYPLQGSDLVAVTREQLAVVRQTETLR